jgi:hypothetical protein
MPTGGTAGGLNDFRQTAFLATHKTFSGSGRCSIKKIRPATANHSSGMLIAQCRENQHGATAANFISTVAER